MGVTDYHEKTVSTNKVKIGITFSLAAVKNIFTGDIYIIFWFSFQFVLYLLFII